jgi:hypothetical protein
VTKTKAFGLVAIYTLLASGLLVVALRDDAAGTGQNLVADVLIAALVTVAIRELYFVRDRRHFLQSYRSVHDGALEELSEVDAHYLALRRWADVTLPDDRDRAKDVSFSLTLDGIPFRTPPLGLEQIVPHLRRIVSEYGAIDPSSFVEGLRAKAAKVAAGVQAIAEEVDEWRRPSDERWLAFLCDETADDAASRRAWADRVHRHLHTIREDAAEVQNDAWRLRQFLTEGYAPQAVAARRFPEPFAPWLLRLSVALGACALLVAVASLAAPSKFPAGFGDGTLNNLLSAGVAAFVAAALATWDRFNASRRVILRSAHPVADVLYALQMAMGAMGSSDDARREDLQTAATVVRDRVNQLQHVTPDPQMGRFADDFIRQIDLAVARSAEDDVVAVSRDTLQSLGLEDWRPPSDAAMGLVDAARNLGDRVTELFMRGRSL